MEKEHQPDSMATITMKPEYPPSEVYSASEPPPAYRQRPSNAVQIARIAAVTVVACSFILGAFILASSWVSARASCHQLEQLDAMLDKELALEGRAYGNDALVADEPLPIGNAHALHASPPASVPEQSASSTQSPVPAKEDALEHAESKVEKDKRISLQKIDEEPKSSSGNSESEENLDSDSSIEDDDELDAIRPIIKLPIQFDLDELAGAFLANNQKGRMNCVVERRNEDPMERRFPFNIFGAFAPIPRRAERIAIICRGGDEPRQLGGFPEPQSQVFAFPLSGPARLPIRPQPEPRGPFIANRPPPFPLPMPWDSSEEQVGQVPREMRIHVQRVITIPTSQNMPPPPENMPFPPPPLPQNREQNEQPTILHQFVPPQAPTQELEQPEFRKIQLEESPVQMNLPWGLTPEDLHMIHRTAEEAVANQRREQQIDNDMQEQAHTLTQVKTIVNTLAAAAEADAQSDGQSSSDEQVDAEPRDMPVQEHAARAPRTLLLPQDMPVDARPHYMQPRSVRSVDGLLHREKRIKRCACDCN